jgi:hypothetical protein
MDAYQDHSNVGHYLKALPNRKKLTRDALLVDGSSFFPRMVSMFGAGLTALVRSCVSLV